MWKYSYLLTCDTIAPGDKLQLDRHTTTIPVIVRKVYIHTRTPVYWCSIRKNVLCIETNIGTWNTSWFRELCDRCIYYTIGDPNVEV